MASVLHCAAKDFFSPLHSLPEFEAVSFLWDVKLQNTANFSQQPGLQYSPTLQPKCPTHQCASVSGATRPASPGAGPPPAEQTPPKDDDVLWSLGWAPASSPLSRRRRGETRPRFLAPASPKTSSTYRSPSGAGVGEGVTASCTPSFWRDTGVVNEPGRNHRERVPHQFKSEPF